MSKNGRVVLSFRYLKKMNSMDRLIQKTQQLMDEAHEAIVSDNQLLRVLSSETVNQDASFDFVESFRLLVELQFSFWTLLMLTGCALGSMLVEKSLSLLSRIGPETRSTMNSYE